MTNSYHQKMCSLKKKRVSGFAHQCSPPRCSAQHPDPLTCLTILNYLSIFRRRRMDSSTDSVPLLPCRASTAFQTWKRVCPCFGRIVYGTFICSLKRAAFTVSKPTRKVSDASGTTTPSLNCPERENLRSMRTKPDPLVQYPRKPRHVRRGRCTVLRLSARRCCMRVVGRRQKTQTRSCGDFGSNKERTVLLRNDLPSRVSTVTRTAFDSYVVSAGQT